MSESTTFKRLLYVSIPPNPDAVSECAFYNKLITCLKAPFPTSLDSIDNAVPTEWLGAAPSILQPSQADWNDFKALSETVLFELDQRELLKSFHGWMLLEDVFPNLRERIILSALLWKLNGYSGREWDSRKVLGIAWRAAVFIELQGETEALCTIDDHIQDVQKQITKKENELLLLKARVLPTFLPPESSESLVREHAIQTLQAKGALLVATAEALYYALNVLPSLAEIDAHRKEIVAWRTSAASVVGGSVVVNTLLSRLAPWALVKEMVGRPFGSFNAARPVRGVSIADRMAYWVQMWTFLVLVQSSGVRVLRVLLNPFLSVPSPLYTQPSLLERLLFWHLSCLFLTVLLQVWGVSSHLLVWSYDIPNEVLLLFYHCPC